MSNLETFIERTKRENEELKKRVEKSKAEKLKALKDNKIVRK